MIEVVPNQDWKYLDVLRRDVLLQRLVLWPQIGLRNYKPTVTSHAADALAESGYDTYLDWYEDTAKFWKKRQKKWDDHWNSHYEGCERHLGVRQISNAGEPN